MTPVEDEQTIQLRVGGRLRELRRAQELRAVDLAARAGLSQGQLSKIETGRAAISIPALNSLCRVLGRPLTYLFQKDEEIPRVLGTMTTVPGPENRATEFFAQEVERRSGGRMALIPLKATILGSAPDQVGLLRQGLIDVFIDELAVYHALAPAVDVTALPYAFDSEAHLRAFLESGFFDHQIRRPLQEAGIRLLNPRWNWRRGLDRVLLATRPISHPRQIRGLKVRVLDSPILTAFWRELGAEPVVVPWPQVKRAWLRGEFDLLPTHKAHLYPLGFCRRGRYVVLLGDVPPLLPVAVNSARYEILPPAVQEALVQACDAAGEFFGVEVERSEVDNEAANLARYQAVYLKVDLAPWRAEAERARRALLASGELDRDVWGAVESLRSGRERG